MATVYLAHDLKHDRPVALKVLHPELGAVLGVDRFLSEIKTTAHLQHPNVLHLFDSGSAEGLVYYTMPFVEGETLRSRLERETQLPIADAIAIAQGIAAALDYAHRHGVIHRDIKPENILLQEGQPVVADFGIALAVKEAGGARLTQTGLSLGTPQYMSPEQATAERELDARSDVYSLGAVTYEMLSGEPPFTGPSTQAVIARLVTEDPRPLSMVRKTVPAPVAAAVHRALEKLPADRFGTAAEFAQAITAGSVAPATGAVATAPSRQRLGSWLTAGALAAGVAILAAGLALGWWGGARAATDSAGPKRLAVLPFENLGDSANQYFSDGMTDEVRGKLASLPALQITARQSSNQYRQSTKEVQQIGRELGVQYLLTATVRWDRAAAGASRVKVSPELIDVSTGTTRWQQSFDAVMSDVFQVQADIASQVAQALDLALGDEQRAALAEAPTANLAAYDAFLKGEKISSSLSASNPAVLRRATVYYEQAITLDSTFALAWIQASRAYSLIYFRSASGDRSDRERARIGAERAIALAPERPEAYLALADYYSNVTGENQRALEQYNLGRKHSPNDASLLTGTALAEQRLGQWEESLQHMTQARELDPRALFTARRHAWTLLWLRRYPEAEKSYERALALDPANLAAIQGRAMLAVALGDLAGARRILRGAPREVEPELLVSFMAVFWDLFWLLDDEHQALLLRLTPAPFDEDRGAWGLALAETHALRGNTAKARAYADSAVIDFEKKLAESPDNDQTRILYALALAYAGRIQEAVSEGERTVASERVRDDQYTGSYYRNILARVYTMAGKPDQAVEVLEALLAAPYFISPAWLRIDPTFMPLRSHPRFQRLAQPAGGG